MTQPLSLFESGLSGRHALVLGAGESGQAAADYLQRQGASVRLVDSRPLEDLAASRGIDLRRSEPEPFAASLLEGIDLVIPSPGLSPHPDRPHSIAALLEAAHQQGIEVATELDLFEWALSSSLDRPAVLAVTGTNGKTTTALLTAHLLRSAGLDVQPAGNVSPSMLRALMDRLDQGRLPQVWVLELSSFQLALSHRFTPTASVILNLTEDHLDWHRDLPDYLAAKLRILGLPLPTGQVWINREEPAVEAAIRDRLAQQAARGTSLRLSSFGLGAAPTGAMGLGLSSDGLDWLALSPEANSRSGDSSAAIRLMPAGALRIPGRHNLLNAMAALGLAMAVQKDLAPMLHGLRTYLGEPHRLQVIGQLGAISFVDDSKGTNVGATVAALRGEDLPVAVILGGEGKGQSFEPLALALADRQAIAVCIGRDGPQIAALAAARGVEVAMAPSMAEAVRRATDLLRARVGEGQGQVLLSPACASFDQFRNYGHRAEAFAEAVAEVCAEAGMTS